MIKKVVTLIFLMSSLLMTISAEELVPEGEAKSPMRSLIIEEEPVPVSQPPLENESSAKKGSSKKYGSGYGSRGGSGLGRVKGKGGGKH